MVRTHATPRATVPAIPRTSQGYQPSGGDHSAAGTNQRGPESGPRPTAYRLRVEVEPDEDDEGQRHRGHPDSDGEEPGAEALGDDDAGPDRASAKIGRTCRPCSPALMPKKTREYVT